MRSGKVAILHSQGLPWSDDGSPSLVPAFTSSPSSLQPNLKLRSENKWTRSDCDRPRDVL
ncbi:hypothetical protein RvY_03411 [Ramazzottius varieornatus]|uniref:Uncharacterized protein n=1 Tax=Ramazzottius varieornatus TaxID=947166 RepID=A0A1D1URC7_RAMVA|nr:hypothetical protein RvY_03411 [Ramazzottius varieornatus]